MRFIGNDPNILDAFYTATADGSIAAGKPVIVTAPGAPTLSSPVEFEAAGTYYYWGTFDSSNNKVVFVYQDNGNSDYGTAVVGTVSGDTVSFGTPVVFESASIEHTRCTFDTSNNKVVIAYKDGGNSNYGTAIVGTVSGTSISFGTAVVFRTFGIIDLAITFDSNENKVVICWPDSSSYGNAIIGTVSGTSISFGSPVVFESAQSTFIAATFDSSNNKVVLAYKDGGNSDRGTAIVGTVSGTSISFGSANVFENDGTHYIAIAFDSSANKVIIAYADAGDNYQGKAVSAEVSGTSINITGNVLTFNTGSSLATGLGLALAYDSAANKMGLAYKDRADGNATFAYLTVSGADLVRSDEAIIFSGNTGAGIYLAPAYDSVAERIVIAYNDQTDSDHGKAVVAINDVGGKIKQISKTSGVGSASTFNSNGSYYQACAYDPSNDKLVIAYRDDGNSSYGTAVVATFDGSSFSFGTPVVFESANVAYVDITYQTNSGRVVIAYEDKGNSSYGTAVVGTVSGTSISFGTPAVFESATTRFISVEDRPGALKVFLFYRDIGNSSYGTGCIGTLSGTSISFGTASVFKSAFSSNMGSAFDTSAEKCAFFYSSGNNGYARVATDSGTSISYGTENEFYTGSAGTAGYDKSVVYHASGSKIVAGFRDVGDGNSAYAVVGTISGTSISFGTPVEFYASYSAPIRAVYNSDDANVAFFFLLGADASKNAVIIGTVSGTSISFGTHEVWQTEAADMGDAAYDPDQSKTLFVYRDTNDSNYGKVRSFVPSTINLTSENYIGIADRAYTDGQDATVAVVGCIDRNQTSLTAGQQYFVQTDGTLSTTADTPSVLAGTAISATELVVKE